jgi:hypothetical protein
LRLGERLIANSLERSLSTSKLSNDAYNIQGNLRTLQDPSTEPISSVVSPRILNIITGSIGTKIP